MKMIVAPASIGAGSLRTLGTVAACILLAATLFACTGGGDDSARDERVLELEVKAHSLEESLEALADENAELKGEIAILREHLDDRDARFQELEEVASKAESLFPSKEQWSKGEDKQSSLPEGTALDKDRHAGGGFRRPGSLRQSPRTGRPHSLDDASGIC